MAIMDVRCALAYCTPVSPSAGNEEAGLASPDNFLARSGGHGIGYLPAFRRDKKSGRITVRNGGKRCGGLAEALGNSRRMRKVARCLDR